MLQGELYFCPRVCRDACQSQERGDQGEGGDIARIPVYADFSGFPPTILTTGPRDLFLSNSVRVHRALKRAGADADLNVYEGESHARFLGGPSVPESREAFADIAAFFDRYSDNSRSAWADGADRQRRQSE